MCSLPTQFDTRPGQLNTLFFRRLTKLSIHQLDVLVCGRTTTHPAFFRQSREKTFSSDCRTLLTTQGIYRALLFSEPEAYYMIR